MVRSSTLPWLKRLKKNKCRWLNPEKSTGIFYCKMGRDLCCWEAVDGAREAFIQIAEEIKGHLEKFSDPVHHPVTWTMYMIGRTKETAEPTIMFCCKETCCRQEVRKTIEESGILDKYPGVRAGDSNRPPDFDQLVQLAPESLESTRPNDPESTRILCELQEHKVGKQIWLEGSDGDISRKATAGGLLRVGQKYFYLTVAHVFTERKAMPPLIDTPDGEDFEFDIGGHDDSDQSDEDATDFIETTSRGSITPERTESSSSSDTMASIKDLSTNTPTSKSRTAEDSMMVANSSKLNTPVLLNLGSIIKEDPVKKNATQENTEGQQGVSFRELPEIESVARNADQELNNSLILNVPSSNINAPTTERISEGFLKPTLKTLGELVVSSEDGSRPGLDYALIETQVNTDIQSVNRVLPISGVTPHFSYLSPPQAANRVPLETTVIAITASAGLLKGKMLGTPTFMRVPSSSTYQELWTVRLEGKLAVGDSGSWVVNAHDGTLLGHIVSGSPETGVVYIVPLYQIFEDIGKRLGVKVQLLTVVDLPTPDMPSSASMETSPLRRRGYDTHDTSRDYPPTQEFAHPSEIATNSLVSGFDTVSVSNDSHYIVSYSAPANSGVWSPPTTSTGHEAPSYDQNDIPSPVMSSEVWYKDSKTGELYQDRKDSRGKTIQTYIKAPREQPRQDVLRNRRDSVFSNTSLEASSSRNTTQRGQSRIRDPSREERPYPPSNSVYSATQIFDSTAYPAGQSHQSFSYPNQLPSSSQHPSSAGGSFTASPYKVSYSQGRSTAGQSYGSQGYSSDDHYQQHSTTNPAHIASSTQASTVSCPDCPSQGQYSGSPPYPETAIGEEDGIVLPTLQSAQQHVKMSSHAGKKHHSHHKKAVDQSSIWSEWAWDESSRQWYCSKKLATGEYEFNYRNATSANQNATNAVETSSSRTAPPQTVTKEQLDKNFKKHNSSYFKPGHIFKTVWFEPESENDSSQSPTDIITIGEMDGEKVHATIRRFVIIATDHGHSQCIPILTYGRQATTKSGVDPDSYAIIYTGDRPPKKIRGEKKLEREPIKVLPKTPQDKLDEKSRVNYAKTHTIEHNTKVCFVGEVDKSSIRRLVTDYDEVWSNKIHLDYPQ